MNIKGLILILAFCLGGLPSLNALALEDKPLASAAGEPSFSMLPESLSRLIKEDYPDYRLPSDLDFNREMLSYLRKDDPNLMPYVIFGDYNGNGLLDVALFLQGPRGWKLLCFNQGPANHWRGYLLDEGPGALMGANYLATQPPGLKAHYHTSDQDKEGFVLKREGIQLNIFDKTQVLYYWDGKGYARLIMGE